MERTLKAELWDKMHYLFRDFNDRMVHVELRYDFEIDINILKTVLICFLEKAPVLHSSFRDIKLKTYWRVADYNIDDVLHVSRPDDLESAINEFLTQYIPPENDLQIQVAVFFHEGGSVLCVIENHMCMDGGDFKYFLKALCKNYSDYAGKGISPLGIKNGSRSFEEVYEDYSKTEKKIAENLYKNVCAKDKHRFPFTENNILDRSFISKRKIDKSRFSALIKSGKAHGATVNDSLVAAYFQSLYELAGYDSSESVTISCAIDLRRHMKETEDTGITNQTAFMQCRIPKLGSDIFETLEYTKKSVERFKKDKFMGLYGLPLLKLGYSIMPQAVSEEIIKIGYSNPLLAMSNIGILEQDNLSLSGHAPYDGYMTGAVKYKPYALLSATSFAGELTLSMCVGGNEEDEKIVKTFFDLMEKNIALLSASN